MESWRKDSKTTRWEDQLSWLPGPEGSPWDVGLRVIGKSVGHPTPRSLPHPPPLPLCAPMKLPLPPPEKDRNKVYLVVKMNQVVYSTTPGTVKTLLKMGGEEKVCPESMVGSTTPFLLW